jgi:hypothetical protein
MSGAQRTAAWRERIRNGRRVYEIEADETALVETLRQNGFLQSVDPAHEEIESALARVIEIWIEAEK